MADVKESPHQRLTAAGAELSSGSGLRVRPQRPVRAVFGALLVVTSVVVALTVYSRVGDRREVLAASRTVLAGEQLTDADLSVVSISSDDSFASVPASSRSSIVGQYAKVRLIGGSLLVTDSVQSRPLVNPERVLMSVAVPLTGVPSGLREGSRLVLILTPAISSGDAAPPILVEATVVAVPSSLGELVAGSSGGTSGTVALSVEVPSPSVTAVGTAAAVAVGVLDPRAPFPPADQAVGETGETTGAATGTESTVGAGG